MKDSLLVSINKYELTHYGEQDYYSKIYTSTIESWEKDELSPKAIMFLLKLSCKLRPQLIWRIYSVDHEVIQELLDKGYAKAANDTVILIRNDRRVEF